MQPNPGRWLSRQGWTPLPFQREAWAAIRRGASGLLHAPTGTGKTLAVWLGILAKPRDRSAGFRCLWITPLRALASDTAAALTRPLAEFAPGWQVGIRTGDTPTAERRRQKRTLPETLVTTPESLSLLLSDPGWRVRFKNIEAVVVDEWQELLATKRGVQVELALARLRSLRPSIQIWGLSATLGNLAEAGRALTGTAGSAVLIEGSRCHDPDLEILLPERLETFPAAGHLGTCLAAPVAARLAACRSALLFTNTRFQAEAWYQALSRLLPDPDRLAIHHGSLESGERQRVEDGLRSGAIGAVVCTSTLDLGVDFSPVDLVFQIGSPKGIARLLQRAGRSGHSPDTRSHLIGVPTHALEILEFHAFRAALARDLIEPRRPLAKPLDVLVQHIGTCALGGGFLPSALLAEVRSTVAYRDLSVKEWDWAVTFASRGGEALAAYPRFQKLKQDPSGFFTLDDPRIGRLHRLNIGTITSDGAISLCFANGHSIGTVEERFLASLRPGQRFSFGGRTLELVRVREQTATVRLSQAPAGLIPSWQGGRSPLSNELADTLLHCLQLYRDGAVRTPEIAFLSPLLDLQARTSAIPVPGRLLVEGYALGESRAIFFFPFGGLAANEGLATVAGFRLSRALRSAVRTTANDYGFSLSFTASHLPPIEAIRQLLAPDHFAADLAACLDDEGLARRQFREVARIAGLVAPMLPGKRNTFRQLQAGSSLLFEVFPRYDPGNLLLAQTRHEVLEGQMAGSLLPGIAAGWSACPWDWHTPDRLSPFAFPLWARQLAAVITPENLQAELAGLAARLESADPESLNPRPTGLDPAAASPRSRPEGSRGTRRPERRIQPAACG